MAESLGEAFIEVLADTSPFGEGLEAGIGDALAGVEDEVSAAFAGVGDAADGAFDGIGDAATGAADDVGEAFEGVGDTIASEVASGVEEAEGSLGGFTDALGSMQGALATAAGGAGLEGFARSQQDATLSVQRGADRMGETEDAVRGMIDGITDWTFSSADAAAGMELLNQRGVDNMDTIEELLPAWDNFADATGQDFVQAMDDGQRALGALGIPAEEAAEHMDALTFMTNEVGVPLDRLSRSLRGSEEDLSAMGIGIDETAGLMAALGSKGLDGRDAVALFNTELGNADGDLDTLLDSLGLTADEFEEYTGKVADAEGITEKQANQANDLATPMERLGGWVENVAFKFGDMGQMAGMLAAPLGALGPAMFGLNQASGLFAKVGPMMGKALGGVAKAFNVLRVAILTNPIFLIAAVIIGIIAVIWIFRDEIMAALGAAWDWIKDVFGNLVDWFKDVWERVAEVVPEALGRVVSWLRDLPGRILSALGGLASTVWDFVKENNPVTQMWRLVSDNWRGVADWFRELPGRILEAIGGLATAVWDFIVQYHPLAMLWRAMTGGGDESEGGVLGWLRGLPGRIVESISGLASTVWDFIKEWNPVAMLWRAITGGDGEASEEGIGAWFSELPGKIIGWLQGLPGAVFEFLQEWHPLAIMWRLLDEHFPEVTALLSNFVGEVITWFTDLAGNVTETVSGWVNGLIDWYTDLQDRAIEIVTNIYETVTGWFTDLASTVATTVSGWVDDLIGFVTNLWDEWVRIVHTIRDAVIGAISGMVSTVVETVSGWVSDLLGFVTGLKDDFLDRIGDLVDGAVDWFRELPGRILSALGDLGSLLWDVGKDIIGGLVGGIKDVAMAPVDAVKDAASSIVGGVKGFLGMSSPSKLMADEIGGPMMEGVAVGIERFAPDALDEIERFANEATSAGQMGALFNEDDLRPVGSERARRPDEIIAEGRSVGQGGDHYDITYEIHTTDPRRAAAEALRRQRELAHLGGPFTMTEENDRG